MQRTSIATIYCVLFSCQLSHAQLLDRSIKHDELSREYYLYVPEGYDGLAPLPLVVNMHGFTSNRDQQVALSEMNPVAEAERFMVAYPNAINSNWQNGDDNVGFIGSMIDEISSTHNVDTSRVYATGLSQGGVMSYLLGANITHRFAAIASVGGIEAAETPSLPARPLPMMHAVFKNLLDLKKLPSLPARPLPMMHVHGTNDVVVPYDGGASLDPGLAGLTFPSVPHVLDAWATRNQCLGEPRTAELQNLNVTDSSTITSISYAQCATYTGADGFDRTAEVLHYQVNGGGHTWPGDFPGWPPELGVVNRDVNASQEIWKFFDRHQLPALPKPSQTRGTTLLSDSFNGSQLHPAWVPVDQNFQKGTDGLLDPTTPQPWGPGVVEAGGQLTLRTSGAVPPMDPPIENPDRLFYDWDTPLGHGVIWGPSTVDHSYANGVIQTKVRVDGESAGGILFRAGNGDGNYVFQAVGARKSFEITSNTGDGAGPGRDETVRLDKVPGLELVPGQDYWMEASALGDRLSMKVWREGDPKPVEPQLNIIDSSFSFGWFGLAAYTHRGFTTGDVAVNAVFDDVTFTVPHALVLDDFNDGNIDGWKLTNALEVAGFGTMIHDASSGALEIATENPMEHGTWDHAILDETNGHSLYANGIFRVVVEAAEGTSGVLSIRTKLSNEATTGADDGYWIGLEPEFGTIGIVPIIDEFQTENFGLFPGILDFKEIGFQADVPYHLEVVADGSSISATAWPVGGNKPAQPQVRTASAETAGGGIGLGASHGPNPPSIRLHSALFDDLTFEQLMPGDFDNNKAIDAFDLDLLANELRQDSRRRIFDMNNDGAVTEFDHTFLVSTLGGIIPGDADLNGVVEFADFLSLSAGFGKEGGWADGNFTTNSLVDFEDFLILSQNFGDTTRAATVPEPNATKLLWIGTLMVGLLRHRSCARAPSPVSQKYLRELPLFFAVSCGALPSPCMAGFRCLARKQRVQCSHDRVRHEDVVAGDR